MAAPALKLAAEPAPSTRRTSSSTQPRTGSPARSTRTRGQSRPDVRVVRGGKTKTSTFLSTVITVGLALVFAIAIIGILRVTVMSASYGLATETSDLRTQISQMESETSSLEIQKSLVASPTNLRSEAEKLNMSAADEATTITLSEDVVKLDAKGNLSLSSSLAAVAAEE